MKTNHVLAAILAVFVIPSTHAGEACRNVDDCPEARPMIVTGTRTPTEADAIGSAYTIITAEQIKNRNVTLVSDLLREVPGISVNRAGPVGALTTIRVRGGESNQTLILVDGIEMNDKSQDDSVNFADILTTDVERIEIIRGPQSALYGSEAATGVINIITRKGTGKPKVEGFFEGGSFGTVYGGGSLSGGGDRYHYKFNGTRLDTNGTDISNTIGDEDDGYENTRLSFKGGFRPLDNLALNLVLINTDSTNDFDGGGFGSDDQQTENDHTFGHIEAKLDLFNGAWQHKLGASTNLADHDTTIDGVFSNSTTSKQYNVDYQTSVFFDTAFLLDATHSLTLALENEHDIFHAKETSPFAVNPRVKEDNTITSYIAEYRLGLMDRLFLSGSVRHDDNTDFEDTTTGRATAAWLFPAQGTRLHFSYGSGVKNPLFVELNSTFTNFIGNPDLTPEFSRGFDVGIAQALFDGRLNLDVTFFRERLKDELFIVFGFPTSQTINLDGTSKRKGVELAMAARLFENTTLSGSYTYLDATQPDPVTGDQIREIRRPEHIASLNLNHRFFHDRANVNLGANFNGRSDDLDFNVFPAETVELSSYVLVNLAGSFAVNRYITLTGRIDNLLNEEYEEPLGFNSSGIAGFAGIRVNFDAF